MRVRATDYRNDWLFGKGQNDYVTGGLAVAQSIRTRLGEVLGDCFFNTAAGLDLFNLLGSKNLLGLNLAIKAIILNTENVTGIIEVLVTVNSARHATLSYKVKSVFSGRPISDTLSLLLTEEGDILVTEDGEGIGT